MAPHSFPLPLHRRSRSRRFRMAGVAAASAGLALLGVALPGSALESVEPLSVKAASDGCPALTAIKYPWLGCSPNEYGGVTLSQPSPPRIETCEWRLPDGECAASPREWNLVPMIPPRPVD